MAKNLRKRFNRGKTSDMAVARSSYTLKKSNKNPCNLIMYAALSSLILLLFLRYYISQTESSLISTHALKDFDLNARFHAYKVLNEFPHDPQAFTQGLEYGGNDTVYESTGLHGQSSVRQVHLQTGKVQRLHRMKSADFGEGLTLLDERLFQVTWMTQGGYIYDQFNFSNVKIFHHPMNDGWGLANDGENLFGSDGSSTIYYIDPVTFKEKHRVTAKYEGLEVFDLNELEYINGEVWANVWQSDCIARISPQDGTVLGWILFHNLRESLISSGYKNIDVLNGIAWDKRNGRLFVTGKLWPKVYQVKLRPLSQQEVKPLGSIQQICQLKKSSSFR